MDSDGLRSLWRAGKLGAINGLIFGGLLELLLRLAFEYGRRRLARLPPASDLTFEMTPYPFNWWYLVFLSFAVVVPASLIVHRCFARHIKSTIWLWQTVGFIAIAEFYLLTLGTDLWYAQTSRMGSDYWRFAWSTEFTVWLFLIAILSVFNLIFGLIVRRVTGPARGTTERVVTERTFHF